MAEIIEWIAEGSLEREDLIEYLGDVVKEETEKAEADSSGDI